MKLFSTIFFIFCLNFIYSNNDSLIVNPWSQLSLFPDSNNYNLFVGGPSSVFKSLLFQNHKLSILNDNPMHISEQSDMPNLNLNVPVVDVQYIIGDQLEQNLAIYHCQPISENSNYAISYLKRTHEGYYLNQGTNADYIQAHYLFKSKAEKYNLNTGIKHHRVFNRQNGGIQNDSNFINSSDVFSNRLLIDVNLNNAFTNDKLFKAYINQSFDLNSSSDSVIKKSNNLNFDLSYSRKFRNYYDSLESYNFLYNYFDSILTNDSLNKNIYSSYFKYSFQSISDSLKTELFFGLKSELIAHNNHTIDTILNNHRLGIGYRRESHNSVVCLNAKYFPTGFKKNNFDLTLNLSKNISKLTNVSADFMIGQSRPVFELQNFTSNHQFWNNSFENLDLLSGSLLISYGKFSYNIDYSQISNPIYFNALSFPEQYEGLSQIIKSTLSHKTNRKKISLFSELIYQYQGGAQIFQLPELIGQLKFNYILTHKKSNLRLNLGINARYYSSFYLMNYSPSINQFSLSQEKLQSEYFIADFIAKTQIKNVTVYAMIAHLNSGFFGYNYFTALHYPSPDRYIKFGLKWLFLN